jgi:membrane-associated phospholipid phosphatase
VGEGQAFSSRSATAFVSYERVRAGMHFPSDVVAGSLAGAAVGVLLPHLHRYAQEAPAVWVGVAAPTRGIADAPHNGSFARRTGVLPPGPRRSKQLAGFP